MSPQAEQHRKAAAKALSRMARVWLKAKVAKTPNLAFGEQSSARFTFGGMRVEIPASQLETAQFAWFGIGYYRLLAERDFTPEAGPVTHQLRAYLFGLCAIAQLGHSHRTFEYLAQFSNDVEALWRGEQVESLSAGHVVAIRRFAMGSSQEPEATSDEVQEAVSWAKALDQRAFEDVIQAKVLPAATAFLQRIDQCGMLNIHE